MKKRWMLWILISLLSVTAVLSGCRKRGKTTPDDEVYETLENVEYEFTVFYDSDAELILKSFMENHPEVKINMLQFQQAGAFLDHEEHNKGLYLKEMIRAYGPPDLILGGPGEYNADFVENYEDGIDIYDLKGCYEKGYIADLSTYCANDTTLDSNAYFPGTFEVFRDKDLLYALPLGISMDFWITTESKYNESAFADLQEGYTGEELLDVLQSEVEKERELDEFFCPEVISEINLLYQLGAVKETEKGIQVDETTFKKVYEFTLENGKQVWEKREGWNEEGKYYTTDNGFVERTAFEPRTYEGKFTASFWSAMDAPAIVLSYATTANEYHVEEGTKAIYIPNYDDGNAYTAAVRVYGAVGAESREPELAYEILRLMMDEGQSYFHILDDTVYPWFHSQTVFNLYPVNKEKALNLLDSFEESTSLMLYGNQGSGRYFQILDRVDVSEEEKEKHTKMLEGIQDLTYLNYDMKEASYTMNHYQAAEIEDYKQCYEKVVEALNLEFENNK